MNITVLLFARLREKIGIAEDKLVLPDEVINVVTLRQWLASRGEGWDLLDEDAAVLCAVNEEMASQRTTLQEGDVVAFFPPVTGG